MSTDMALSECVNGCPDSPWEYPIAAHWSWTVGRPGRTRFAAGRSALVRKCRGIISAWCWDGLATPSPSRAIYPVFATINFGIARHPGTAPPRQSLLDCLGELLLLSLLGAQGEVIGQT